MAAFMKTLATFVNMRIERRAELYGEDIRKRLGELWLSDEPAARGLVDFWRAAGVADPRDIELMIKREAAAIRKAAEADRIAAETERLAAEEAERLAAEPALIRDLKRTERDELFTETSRALLGSLWIEENKQARGLLTYWRATGMPNVLEIERMMKREAAAQEAEAAKTATTESGGVLVLINPVNTPTKQTP